MTGSVATPLLVLWRLQALQLLLLLYLLRSSSRSRNCVQPAFVLSWGSRRRREQSLQPARDCSGSGG